MTLDPTVAAAVVAGAAAVIGPPITWAITRRRVDRAGVELTEAQAEQIRSEVWARLNATLRDEIARLQTRVTELESRLAVLDRALQQRDAELAAVQAERDSLRVRLAEAHAHLQEREREIGDLKAALERSIGGAT
jgi:chromosome segregation ATPase